MAEEPRDPETMSIAELLESITWEDIVADGIITLEEVEAELAAQGYPPDRHDPLYDGEHAAPGEADPDD